jgi:hypothetical protein
MSDIFVDKYHLTDDISACRQSAMSATDVTAAIYQFKDVYVCDSSGSCQLLK